MQWIVNLLKICCTNCASEFLMKIIISWILVDWCTLLDCTWCPPPLKKIFCFITVMFYWGWPSNSFPSDWVSYGTGPGMCTVCVNMITSLEDTRIRLYAMCAGPPRECTKKLLYWSLQHRGMDWIYLHNEFSYLTVSCINLVRRFWQLKLWD